MSWGHTGPRAGSGPPSWALLTTLTELIEAGKVTPVIDRGYPFADIGEAVGYQQKGHPAGKVAVTVAG